MTNIPPNLNTSPPPANISQDPLATSLSNSTVGAKRKHDSPDDNNPQAEKRQHIATPVDPLLSKQFSSGASEADNKAKEKLHSAFDSTTTPTDGDRTKTEAAPLKRQTTYENLGVLFDKRHEDGGELIGTGNDAKVHAAGNDMIVRIPTPDENNTGLTSNLKEYLVTQLVKEIFNGEPETLSKINLVESFAISRGKDNGGHYGDSGPLSIVAMPRMDGDLKSLSEQGKITGSNAFLIETELNTTINERLEDMGLVHSDFSIGNILGKTLENGELESKVTDFGAATIDENSEAHEVLSKLWDSLKSNLLSKNEIDASHIENINIEDLFEFSGEDDFLGQDDLSDQDDSLEPVAF